MKKIGNYVIAFSSNIMGEGDSELGEVLIQSFCAAILEKATLPSSIVFYNSGVKLALEGHPVVTTFTQMEKEGVKLLLCGTCVKHFNASAAIRVGSVSNMHDITDILTNATSVIRP